jgi:hypothetical protein
VPGAQNFRRRYGLARQPRDSLAGGHQDVLKVGRPGAMSRAFQALRLSNYSFLWYA